MRVLDIPSRSLPLCGWATYLPPSSASLNPPVSTQAAIGDEDVGKGKEEGLVDCGPRHDHCRYLDSGMCITHPTPHLTRAENIIRKVVCNQILILLQNSGGKSNSREYVTIATLRHDVLFSTLRYALPSCCVFRFQGKSAR